MNIQEQNLYIMSLMSRFLNDAPCLIDASAVSELSNACSLTREEAYTYILAAYCGIDIEGDGGELFNEYFLKMIREIDRNGFENDPYYRNIALPSVKCGRIELSHSCFKPYEAFVCDDTVMQSDGRIIPQIGFFAEEQSYPAIMEDDRIWMTVTPLEINTMRPAIAAAHGKVLAYGLGLGYFAYMAALKPEVDSVTVVELNETIIELFRKYILPQFGTAGKKLSIIHADAFEYAGTEMGEGSFDFVFTDLWHDVSDGTEMYFRMKEYEKYSPEAEFSYWIEQSILCHLRGF